MILLVLAAAAGATASAPEQKFETCLALAEKDAVKAIEFATSWQVEGGGLPARHCLGLAYAAQQRWLPAMTAFEQAARAAERERDGRAANFWVQAGNSALAANQPAKAREAFDAAIASGTLKGTEAGEVHLDRARALAAIGDVRAARADLDLALKLVPNDPLGWLLSATLARRTGDLARAANDITEAGKRSPDDASVALEAGNIALMSGSPAAARTAWEAAVKNAPQSAAGKSAAEALKNLN